MSVKISALPSTTASTFNDWLIKNDSAETTTSKAELKYVLGLTNMNGNNAIQSNKFLTSLGTTASTESAIAFGNGAEATSPYSIAIGYAARNDNRDGARNNYICIGTETRAVQESFALGTRAKALGASTCSVGEDALTLGNSALALGKLSYSQSTQGVALGYNARDEANSWGIALGSNSLVQGVDLGVAIGYNAQVYHTQSVVLGNDMQSEYSATTKTKAIQSTGQIFNAFYDNGSGSTFTINWELGNSQKITMNGNTSLTFTGLRNGAQYRLQVVNGGTFTLTGATAAGYTILCEGGAIPNITNNGVDLCVLEVMGTDILVRHFAGFAQP